VTSAMRPTVFFGPFIGEFGWEFKFWQGWVRRMCRGPFRDHWKVAASFPGRHVFYPDVDEFWPHPPHLAVGTVSALGYITDYWRNGWPKPNRRFEKRGFFGRSRWVKETFDAADHRPDVEPRLVALLEEYRAKLGAETTWFVPWRLNVIDDDRMTFGATYPDRPAADEDFVQYSIPFHRQALEPLRASEAGRKALAEQGATDATEFIAIFPRHRRLRRPDKNWQQDRWDALLPRLRRRWPQLQIAILGEPGGAFYEDGVPAGCLDLINVPPDVRLDTQIALLQRARVAIGTVSGAIIVAQATGAPTVTWDYPGRRMQAETLNFFDTPMICLDRIDPSVETVEEAVATTLASAGQGQTRLPTPGDLLRRTKALDGVFRFKFEEVPTGSLAGEPRAQRS